MKKMIYLELFFVFFTIGLFTLGGGYAMIPMIEEQVISRGWMTHEELYNFIGISESTPGPFAVNIATFIGHSQAGILGSITATISVVLPSFIIILLIAKFLHNFLKYKQVRWALDGVKPIIVGLLFAVVLSLINNNIMGGDYNWRDIDFIGVAIMGGMFILKAVNKRFSPILLIIISALLGLVLYQVF
ncbi:MAG: chromate transporter [Bacilli bacterium]|nr:chromate transporter [Bacilli bacterium]